MNAITIHLPDDMLEKIESLAKSKDIALDALIVDIMRSVVRERDAEMRFRERAERGRGREQEALDLLRR
jgi:predicted transcriptional regulator